MLLLYAIELAATASGEGKPQPHGIDDEPLSVLTAGELAAVVSDEESAPQPIARNFIAYERVIERLMTRGTILPARFGTTLETEREVKTMLVTRQAEFLEALQRVQGAVEFAVRIPEAADSKPQAKPKSGTDYMQRLVNSNRQANELTTQVENATRGLPITIRRSTRSLACLVHKQVAEEFVNRTRAKGLTVTGPWPPYSFVNR